MNDLVFDAEGNLYFTDQGQSGLHDPSGRLYRLRPDGRLDLLLANVPSPNGVALSPDGRVLYLAVTRGNCVWRVPLLPDGSVAKVGQFFTSYGPSGPDGLAVDDQGRLLVANPGLGLVWVLNHRAEPVQVLRGVPGSSLTNLAFGGADRRTLYVTDSTHGRILRARLAVATFSAVSAVSVVATVPQGLAGMSRISRASCSRPIHSCSCCMPALSTRCCSRRSRVGGLSRKSRCSRRW